MTQVRLTFDSAAPLLHHILTTELEAEGFEVVPGPPPLEQRSVGHEVVEAVRVTLEVLGGAQVVEGTPDAVSRIVRALAAALSHRPTTPELVVTIYGPDGKPLKDVRIPAQREER